MMLSGVPPQLSVCSDPLPCATGDVPGSWTYSLVLLMLPGLESFELTPEIPFVNIGERCNLAGSLRFKRMIEQNKYEDALAVALEQVENGAQLLDVNMDAVCDCLHPW